MQAPGSFINQVRINFYAHPRHVLNLQAEVEPEENCKTGDNDGDPVLGRMHRRRGEGGGNLFLAGPCEAPTCGNLIIVFGNAWRAVSGFSHETTDGTAHPKRAARCRKGEIRRIMLRLMLETQVRGESSSYGHIRALINKNNLGAYHGIATDLSLEYPRQQALRTMPRGIDCVPEPEVVPKQPLPEPKLGGPHRANCILGCS